MLFRPASAIKQDLASTEKGRREREEGRREERLVQRKARHNMVAMYSEIEIVPFSTERLN